MVPPLTEYIRIVWGTPISFLATCASSFGKAVFNLRRVRYWTVRMPTVQAIGYLARKAKNTTQGYRDITPIMENQMEKKIENEMETGNIWTSGTLNRACELGSAKKVFFSRVQEYTP